MVSDNKARHLFMSALLQIAVWVGLVFDLVFFFFFEALFHTKRMGEFMKESIVCGSGGPLPLLLPETTTVVLVVLPDSSKPW